MLRLSQIESAKAYASRALRAFSGLAGALKFKYKDIEMGIDLEPEKGLADNGDLEGDLTALLVELGSAAAAVKTVIVLFIDELQHIEQDQFAALISALYRCAQLKLPITMVGLAYRNY
jgi:hypothetical protein